MYVKNGNIFLSNKINRDTIRHEEVDYVLSYLSEDHKNSKGGNSNVFKLINPQTDDVFVIKFSRYDIKGSWSIRKNAQRILRFQREVEALELSVKLNLENVIYYYFNGYKDIGAGRYHYYVMEKADYDLTQYLDSNEVSNQQRLLLCTNILNGIYQLHENDIYHRDIKPDNILFVNDVWKIGDLGLIENRNSEFIIKEFGEKIGPIGWLSPEATNKFLNEGHNRVNRYALDCSIDSFSDIFQLGKLFWFIFQGNIPIGQISRDDFKIADNEIFALIFSMLKHSKDRPAIDIVEAGLKDRFSDFAL